MLCLSFVVTPGFCISQCLQSSVQWFFVQIYLVVILFRSRLCPVAWASPCQASLLYSRMHNSLLQQSPNNTVKDWATYCPLTPNNFLKPRTIHMRSNSSFVERPSYLGSCCCLWKRLESRCAPECCTLHKLGFEVWKRPVSALWHTASARLESVAGKSSDTEPILLQTACAVCTAAI